MFGLLWDWSGMVRSSPMVSSASSDGKGFATARLTSKSFRWVPSWGASPLKGIFWKKVRDGTICKDCAIDPFYHLGKTATNWTSAPSNRHVRWKVCQGDDIVNDWLGHQVEDLFLRHVFLPNIRNALGLRLSADIPQHAAVWWKQSYVVEYDIHKKEYLLYIHV